MNRAALILALASLTGPAQHLFEGREQSFLVVGDSTSYGWPDILEQKLNRRFQDQVLYHVMNAAAETAPVRSWISPPGTGEWERSYGRMLQDWFLPLPHRPDLTGSRRYPNLPRPRAALVQSSGPAIIGPRDENGIRAGADALEQLVRALHLDGVELIFITTHIYKFTHEPQIEHEKYALAELLSRRLPYLWPGPDVWTPTRGQWPAAFVTNDQVHPNRKGDALLAHLWFEHLERFDRGELEQNLESAWSPDWKRSVTLTEGLKTRD